MASEYSSKLKFELIGSGEQASLWGTTTNKNLGELVEQAIAGVTNLKLDSYAGIKVLDSLDGVVDQARSAVISCYYDVIPASGAVSVVVPTSTKLYLARNSCGQTVTFKTATQIGGVEVATGESTLVFCNGAEVVQGIATGAVGIRPVSQGGTGTDNFGAGGFIKSPGTTSALTAQSKVVLTSDVSGALPIANGGTGVTGFTNGQLLIGTTGGAIATLNGGINGYIPIWNGSAWVPGAQATGAVTSVNGLTGAVSITTSSIGAYPTSNPSNYITSSSLVGYAQLASSPTFTGSVFAQAFTAQGAGSIGDQKVVVAYGGYSTGLNPGGIQIGAGGYGIQYTPAGTPNMYFITSWGANAAFRSDGLNAQGNNQASWYTGSDRDIKTNIAPITGALTKINGLKPTAFAYKDRPEEPRAGFIAQEFENVFPEMVIESPADEKYQQYLPEGKTTVKGINQELSAYFVGAIQELSAKVDAQAAEIAALKYPKTGA